MKAPWLAGFAACVALASLAGAARADDRFAVVHVTNNTKTDMSFYRKWVWNYGTKEEKVARDWRVTTIPAGKTYTVHWSYDGKDTSSPDLIVVFDSDREKGVHWEMVKLTRGRSPDYKDKTTGYTYVLDYDGKSKEFASLKPKNGGKVEILDRKAKRPKDAEKIPF